MKKYSYYYVWWIATFLIFLLFDVYFCFATNFFAFGFKAIYVFLITLATLFSLPAALSRRQGWQVALLILLSALLEANLLYCRTYSSHIPLESYMLVGNLKDFTGSVTDSLRWYDAAFPIVIAAAWLVCHYKIKTRHTPPRRIYFPALALLLGVSYSFFLAKGGFVKRMAELYSGVNMQSSMAPVFSVFSCMVYEGITMTGDLTAEERQAIDTWLMDNESLTAAYAETCAARDTSESPRNIVFVLCESLESWPIGLEIEGKEITPFLNSVLSDSATYYNPNVVTQVGDGRSIDAQLLMLAGQLPLRSSVYSTKYTGNEYYTVPKALKQRGVRSVLVSSDAPTTWNQRAVANAFGVDSLISIEDFNLDMAGARMPDKSLSDYQFFAQSVEKLRSGDVWPQGEPVFLSFVTHSGHNPFTIPEALDSLRLEGDYDKVLRDYMTVANYTDRSIKVLVDYLQTRPDWPNTSVVITGDHEGLASYRKCLACEYDYVSPQQLTPLIILNSPHGTGRDEKFIEQVDVYSALLDIAGEYGRYGWRGMGQSPFSPTHPGIAIGTNGNISGEPDSVAETVLDHMKDSRTIGDRIIRYRLF